MVEKTIHTTEISQFIFILGIFFIMHMQTYLIKTFIT